MPPARTEPRAIVYQVRNLVNGKRYIGVTKRGLHNRMRAHLSQARTGRGNLLHRAIRKYGRENFVFEVLHDFVDDYDLARVYEFEMICKHRPEYNLSAGGEGGTPAPSTIAKIRAAHLGKKRSPRARANMSEGQRVRARENPPSAETREKMRTAKLGQKHRPESIAKMVGRKDSPETRAKKSAAQTGRPPTKGRTGQPVPSETREKIRQSLKARQWVDTPARIASRARTGASAASEARKIPVRCLDDGHVFDCVKAAALFYGFDQMKLGAAIREQKMYRGRRFERLPKTS
mgnify:CR=1 FL=1